MFPTSFSHPNPLNAHIYATFWYIIFFIVKICELSEGKVGVCVKNVLISSLSGQAKRTGELSTEVQRSQATAT